MKNWKAGLITGGKSLAEVKIQRGLFWGNALLFVIAIMLLNHILKKRIGGDTIYPTPPLGHDMTQGQF